ncbi:putative tetratricopeptide-like helical domain-containing protein [Medicago truncatula]|uniref:PPR containing plant-like protein n=1 Tax=Medicago truncatula TaxID=3880 RepID=G7KRP3_MEDTR|nr:pentatricopeptide repeat-containing protein At4g26680, mitochondrial [Medicago truncatula]AES81262.1 PPR containing plant-like protein [Medicago truncatula]RHN47772.1 putative tetratricopeptide-like helical domain-containing protein [Medicago truncatula]
MKKTIRFHQFSTTSIQSHTKTHSPYLPIPHRTLPQPKGQDLDFINIFHSHFIHSQWEKLTPFSKTLTPFKIQHILLKLQNDAVLSLKFFNWVQTHNPNSHTLHTHSFLLHILTKNRNFKTAQSIFSKIITTNSNLFESLLHSYTLCNSSPLVFDTLFKTFAHMNKLRNATDTFVKMKEYGFFPTVESCNAFLSSMLYLKRPELVVSFYRQMRRNRISPNVYTINMVVSAYCKLGELNKASEVLEKMKDMGLCPNVVTFNSLISGYCDKGLLGLALKVRDLMMGKNGVFPNVVTFNTLINGFCKEGKLHEANRVFSEMKLANVAPNVVTYNTLINGFGQAGNSEMGIGLFEEMERNKVKADILTYNGLILGLCKEGKTKKAAYMVKELDKGNLVPNASTFSALIAGQCVRNNSERAFLVYRSMVRSGFSPNENTFRMLASAFCKNEDFDGAVQVLRDMLERFMTPDSSILSEVYSGLCRCGRKQFALMLCSEIEAKRLLPQGFDREKIVITGSEHDTSNSTC